MRRAECGAVHMSSIGRIGDAAIRGWRRHRDLVASAAMAVVLALRPGSWRRPVRSVLARQVLFTGVDAIPFVSMVAAVIGLLVVLQTQTQLARLGQTAFVGPILVMVVIREAGPLLVNFVVIMRSGTAIASELSAMQLDGQIRVLDSQGLDPFPYLALPRAVGVAISVFCLTILFVLVSFAVGYAAGVLMEAPMGSGAMFVESVAKAILPADILNLVAKTLIPGLLTGIICTSEGLGVRRALTEIPQAATRGVVRSVAALFFVLMIVSLVTYL